MPDVRVKDLEMLRSHGWRVAAHNDYEQDGVFMTFWLLTHPSGYYIKGEGPTDEEAIAAAVIDARALQVVLDSQKKGLL